LAFAGEKKFVFAGDRFYFAAQFFRNFYTGK